MKKIIEVHARVLEARQQMQRLWLMGGILPLAASALLTVTVSAVWATPLKADEHIVQRGFQAVLAICAALFLAGFWLDGRWTNSERIARSIWRAAGGDEFSPSRSQLAAQADLAFKTVAGSTSALTFLGAAIAVAALISVWAGLGIADGAQLLLLGFCYQLFVLSRHPYYEELLSAAVRGELVVAEDEDHNNRK